MDAERRALGKGIFGIFGNLIRYIEYTLLFGGCQEAILIGDCGFKHDGHEDSQRENLEFL